MTCKDCICESRCKEVYETFGVFIDFEKSEGCKHFKNKADFVEVVRCKDCKHGEFGIFNGQGEKEGCYCNLNGEGYAFDWYCKGGERKNDKE